MYSIKTSVLIRDHTWGPTRRPLPLRNWLTRSAWKALPQASRTLYSIAPEPSTFQLYIHIHINVCVCVWIPEARLVARLLFQRVRLGKPNHKLLGLFVLVRALWLRVNPRSSIYRYMYVWIPEARLVSRSPTGTQIGLRRPHHELLELGILDRALGLRVNPRSPIYIDRYVYVWIPEARLVSGSSILGCSVAYSIYSIEGCYTCYIVYYTIVLYTLS